MGDTDGQYERPELVALTASPASEPEIRRWRADMVRAIEVLDRVLAGELAVGAAAEPPAKDAPS